MALCTGTGVAISVGPPCGVRWSTSAWCAAWLVCDIGLAQSRCALDARSLRVLIRLPVFSIYLLECCKFTVKCVKSEAKSQN